MKRLLPPIPLLIFSLPEASAATHAGGFKPPPPFFSLSSGRAPRRSSTLPPFNIAAVTGDQQTQIGEGVTPHTARVSEAVPPSLTLDLSGSTGSILTLFLGRYLTGQLAVAKLATVLALVYGLAFRFCDDFILETLCVRENTKKEEIDEFSESKADNAIATNRSLVRRIGRRVLALGVAGYNLFFCGTSAMTAVGTSGTVLLLDRLSRTVEKHKHRQAQQRRQMEHQKKTLKNESELQCLARRLARRSGWERFTDQIKLHLHSILAWSGVLHSMLPAVTRGAVQVVGILYTLGTLKDVFFPNFGIVDGDLDFLQEQETRSLLSQASGYVMAGLSVFLVTLASSTDGGPLEDSSAGVLMNAFGFAWLVNLYSATCFFPHVMMEGKDHYQQRGGETSKDDDNEDNTTTWKVLGGFKFRGAKFCSLRKALYVLWLVANGAIAATLISSPNQRLPSTTSAGALHYA